MPSSSRRGRHPDALGVTEVAGVVVGDGHSERVPLGDRTQLVEHLADVAHLCPRMPGPARRRTRRRPTAQRTRHRRPTAGTSSPRPARPRCSRRPRSAGRAWRRASSALAVQWRRRARTQHPLAGAGATTSPPLGLQLPRSRGVDARGRRRPGRARSASRRIRCRGPCTGSRIEPAARRPWTGGVRAHRSIAAPATARPARAARCGLNAPVRSHALHRSNRRGASRGAPPGCRKSAKTGPRIRSGAGGSGSARPRRGCPRSAGRTARRRGRPSRTPCTQTGVPVADHRVSQRLPVLDPAISWIRPRGLSISSPHRT